MAGLPLDASVGNVVAIPVIHPVEIGADVAETVYKVYPGIKGRIIKVVGIPGIQGGSVVATDLDLTFYKSTTVLNSTAVAAVNSSAAASTEAALTATLTTTAASVAIGVDDYISIDYDITGGTSPTVNGAGAIFYIARE